MKTIFKKIPYFSYFGSILSTATFKQSSITFTGTILNGALGAVFFILVARFLGPAEFGLMSVAIATLTLLGDIGDLGTDTGLVNFVSRNVKKDPEKAKRFLKLGIKVKLAAWIFVLVVGIVFSNSIALFFFNKPELAGPLRIGFFGVGSYLLFSFITHSLQAYQRFWSWSAIQVGTNGLRVVFVFILFFFFGLTLSNSLWLYVLMPLAGFAIGIYLISPSFLKVKKETKVAREFFKYNGWVAAFTLMAALGARMDTFISARLLSATELGLYSAALQMVRIVPMIVGALGTVIAPKMAEMSGVKELVGYIKKTQAMVIGLSVLGLLSIPVVLFFIPILFGVEYLASGPLFIVLLLGALVFLIAVPVHMAVFYYFSFPKLFFWLSLAHLILVSVLSWNFIPVYGPMGAAIAVLIGHVFNFIIPLVWVFRQIRTRLTD